MGESFDKIGAGRDKVLEQLRPPRVVRQDAGMKHLGVAEDDMRAPADDPSGILWRVTVVGECPDLFTVAFQSVGQRVKLGELILGQGFGGKQIEGPARRLGEDGAQDRHVVAKGLARCGR